MLKYTIISPQIYWSSNSYTIIILQHYVEYYEGVFRGECEKVFFSYLLVIFETHLSFFLKHVWFSVQFVMFV